MATEDIMTDLHDAEPVRRCAQHRLQFEGQGRAILEVARVERVSMSSRAVSVRSRIGCASPPSSSMANRRTYGPIATIAP